MLICPKGDEAAKKRSQVAFAEIVDVAIDMGGTVTGEHGVGLVKLEGMRRELGPIAVGMQRAIKHASIHSGSSTPARRSDRYHLRSDELHAPYGIDNTPMRWQFCPVLRGS